MKYQLLFVLGASDPEMQAIESLLTECGVPWMHATRDGKRVHPGNAYDASDLVEVPTNVTVVALVECFARLSRVNLAMYRCDHHREGDTGFERPPAEFLRSSSLGQVIAILARAHETEAYEAILRFGWERVEGGDRPDGGCSVGVWDGSTARDLLEGPAIQLFPDGRYHVRIWTSSETDGVYSHMLFPDQSYHMRVSTEGDKLGGCVSWLVIPHELVLTAAADHCLGAAYRGECPGVDSEDLRQWRMCSRAEFQRRTVAEVEADVEAAKQVLTAAPWVTLYSKDFRVVRDLRRPEAMDDARGYAVPELPEAALQLGVGYLAGPLKTPDGRVKYVVSGKSEHVEAFRDHWAPANGLVDVYAFPERGMGGGYVP